MSRPTVVSLSTIPSRFHLIEPTLKSLLSQSLKFQEIRVYIPMEYRRFTNWDGALPPVPSGVSIVRCDKDYGPATKVLPAARDLKDQNVDILFCDDDKIYDAGWHKRFKDASAEHPDACIVEVGESFPDISDDCRPTDRLPRGRWKKKNSSYRTKRILSLFLYKPNLSTAGYVDQLAGFAGVLVRPEWFDEAFYDIPDVMWTVDDPWLSGHLERRGIPIWMTGKRKHLPETEGASIDSLLGFVEAGHNRVNADLLVIDYFREKYGIWKKGGELNQESSLRTGPMRELARRRERELQLENSQPA
ncbi:glycosyltransferase family 2 protein [Ochrobactrum chromiisoli]|uniref:Glycosyltransferase family 2 protein n=1 Tax=Ochrobactrum chromiisoli TaxID=2993941 RepID=A0ABT3QRV9_9HYPH|nr:glycosyltransferase family 2 protein [Ochrobactrum chromiisoli]MCX2698350.1 glycosyltransferase family 2 protein [Ochrobactrum chromiisoli]